MEQDEHVALPRQPGPILWAGAQGSAQWGGDHQPRLSGIRIEDMARTRARRLSRKQREWPAWGRGRGEGGEA